MTVKKTQSIRTSFNKLTRIMILIGIFPLLISVLFFGRFIIMYRNAIANIGEANDIKAKVENRLLEAMWDMVYGTYPDKPDAVMELLSEIRADFLKIEENTRTPEELGALAVSVRTLDSLDYYYNIIRSNIEGSKNSVEENSILMVDVHSIYDLLIVVIDDFVQVEIEISDAMSQSAWQTVELLLTLFAVIIAAITVIIISNHRFIKRNIEKPVDELILMSKQIAEGNFEYRIKEAPLNELSQLSESINDMALRLQVLIDENTRKEKELADSEMRVLQSQISPHFIYNSLDAVLSLTRQGNLELVSKMTYALSSYFRITLSKGQDTIPLKTELQHIEDYLTILKIRYGEKLMYEIRSECGGDDEEVYILKTILQPLVENAVYHGTKFVRRRGMVRVFVSIQDGYVNISVADNGIGIEENRLKAVERELSLGLLSDFDKGYGLVNVNKRLILFYGNDVDFNINSVYGEGTTVNLRLKAKRRDAANHV